MASKKKLKKKIVKLERELEFVREMKNNWKQCAELIQRSLNSALAKLKK
jgi:hypothetical protein